MLRPLEHIGRPALLDDLAGVHDIHAIRHVPHDTKIVRDEQQRSPAIDELAQQVDDALTPYATAVNLRVATAVGGMSIGRQAGTLRRGAEVLVATPGRLKDLIERGDCVLDQVAITVLDEADQMADMGFMPQVTALLKQVEPGGQRLLFSATLDKNIDRLVKMFLTDPVVHWLLVPKSSGEIWSRNSRNFSTSSSCSSGIAMPASSSTPSLP